ncbi:toll/interleukin-1 receptor-like protein [Cannabis sativa]|uniref:toll/interleukin-1 receptor-like protein n=1 Tax=Cannabis sativa TaxID=3483 RepID=UPI0029C9EC63|nr:toll/interleukin-1 receptor-like protein [Cannabis sativa]
MAMADNNQPPTISYSQKKYDVFISFRGEDTRTNFTSHLHKALKDGGIQTYIDEYKLERGQVISKALLEAIEDSKISIVVFSKDYASSSWCLAELAHIIQCVERNTQIVVPVFYHVEPSDVRKQKGSYAEAFEKHDSCHDDATIRKWRDALTKAANHKGWHVSNSSNEAQVVHDIFDFVRKELRSISPSHHYSKLGFVGIEESIADVKKLLSNSVLIPFLAYLIDKNILLFNVYFGWHILIWFPYLCKSNLKGKLSSFPIFGKKVKMVSLVTHFVFI